MPVEQGLPSPLLSLPPPLPHEGRSGSAHRPQCHATAKWREMLRTAAGDRSRKQATEGVRVGGGGVLGTPAYAPQNDARNALIILSHGSWGNYFLKNFAA